MLSAVTKYVWINTHVPEVTTISGIIEWVDNDNQAGIRPEDVIVDVFANGIKVKSKTISSVNSDIWKYAIAGLWKNEAGVPIVYTVKHSAVSGYTTTVSGTAVTNVVIPTPTPTPSPTHERGDVDGDGKISLSDAQMELKAALKIIKL